MAVAAPGAVRLTGIPAWNPDRDATAGHGYTSTMIKRIALLCFLSCLLAACGNKGPLVMPDKPQTDTTTPAAETGTPATTTDAPTSTTP